MLIAAGSDVNEIHVSEHLADFYISSPLMYACEQGNFDVAKELSALGADVNAVLFEGEFDYPYNSPLILASTRGHVDIVKFILARKDFKAVDTISYALVEVCENEHTAIVAVLWDRAISTYSTLVTSAPKRHCLRPVNEAGWKASSCSLKWELM